MKYWHYKFDEVMDMMYLDAMMLNATIPSLDTKGSGSSGSNSPMSFFDFGKQLAGMN